MYRGGRAQSALLQTSDPFTADEVGGASLLDVGSPFEDVPLPGLAPIHDDARASAKADTRGEKRGYPEVDGTLAQPAEHAAGQYNAGWVVEEQRRLRELRENPKYQFMLKVEGVTSPLLTMKHLHADHCDPQAARLAELGRKQKLSDQITLTRVGMAANMIGGMANHQKLRLQSIAGNEVGVSTSDPAIATDNDQIDAALQEQRHGRRDPVSLVTWMDNINTVVNKAATAPVNIPDLVGSANEMAWAMQPQHSGVLTYTAMYIAGLELASIKLQDIVGVTLDADAIVIAGTTAPGAQHKGEIGLSMKLAMLVAYEILDNDTMVTRRYSKQFQERSLMKKRQMLIRSLQKHFGVSLYGGMRDSAAFLPGSNRALRGLGDCAPLQRRRLPGF